MDIRRTLLWIFICSLGLMGLLGVVALLLPNMPKKVELLWTALLLTVYSLAGLISAGTLSRRRFVALTWTATGLLLCSLMGWLLVVWIASHVHWMTQESIARPTGTVTIIGVLAMHALLLLLVPLCRSPGKLVRVGTILAAAVVGLWLVFMIWSGFDFANEFVGRMIAAVAILGSLGTIVTPILGRLEKLSQHAAGDTSLSGTVPVVLSCPRCAQALTIAANKMKRCEGCGLKIKIQFEEPRCRCGYLLLGLTGDTCPECGKPIAQDDRWRETSTGEPREKPADSEDQ